MRFPVCVCACCDHGKTESDSVTCHKWAIAWGKKFHTWTGFQLTDDNFRLIVQHKNTNIIAKMHFCVISKRYFQPQRFLTRTKKSIDLRSVFCLAFLLFFDVIQTTSRQVDVLTFWVEEKMVFNRKHILIFFFLNKNVRVLLCFSFAHQSSRSSLWISSGQHTEIQHVIHSSVRFIAWAIQIQVTIQTHTPQLASSLISLNCGGNLAYLENIQVDANLMQ